MHKKIGMFTQTDSNTAIKINTQTDSRKVTMVVKGIAPRSVYDFGLANGLFTLPNPFTPESETLHY